MWKACSGDEEPAGFLDGLIQESLGVLPLVFSPASGK